MIKLDKCTFFYSGIVLLFILLSVDIGLGGTGHKVDSGIDIPPSEKAEKYLELFIQYRKSNADTALYFADKSRALALQVGDSLLYVRALYAIGYIYKGKDSYKEAIKYYYLALKTARNNNFEDREKTILNGLALAYYYDGKYDEALKYNFESLALREREGNKSEIAIACNNIGLVYYKIKDFQTGIQYFKKSIKLKEQINDNKLEPTLINLGLCYTVLEDYEEAIRYYERALKLCNTDCGSYILEEAYNGMGVAYYSQKKYDLAEASYRRAIDLAKQNNNSSQKVISLYNLAKVKLEKGNIQQSLELLNESQLEAIKINYRIYISSNYELYGDIYSKLAKYDLAYVYQKKYDSIQKEIMNDGIIQNLAKVQIDYQERENLETISHQRSRISKTTTLLILSIIIIILALVILIILYSNNRHKRKVNKKLSEANDIIEKQNMALTNMNNVLEERVRERTQELKASNSALVKSNTELDNFIYKTSHDIRGPLATLQGICNVALIDVNDVVALDYFGKLEKTAARLNEILSKLLVINQINNSLISNDIIDFDLITSELLSEQQNLGGLKLITVDKEVQQGLSFRSDQELVRIILANLISNAFKFHNTSSRIESFINIQVVKINDNLSITVIDNGIGIHEDVSSKIFEIFSKASHMSDTAGLGLYLVKLAVEKLGGEISQGKTPQGYTQFEVTLPYM